VDLDREDEALMQWLSTVAEYLGGRTHLLDVPLDVQGTAFQKRVWGALSDIPRGETRSYSQVASALGAPSSARAVAQACASNPVAIVIPCHRVVRSSGDTSGYRWGAERKKRILAVEHAVVARRVP
jgi:AraC family transcriptional regulator of adaptative response/methylated-DNA-[protein]-cysteine methyltransferase